MKLKLFISVMAGMAITASMSAAAPDGLYDDFEGQKGATLRSLIKHKADGHTKITYGDKTWDAFESTDTRMVDGRLCWWDMYSNENVSASGGGHSGLNIEHAIPKSWWGGGKNTTYCDLFNLNPSESGANSRKNNYPWCELKDVTWTNGVTSVGKPKDGMGGGAGNGFEPLDEYKGDFARGAFYMFTTYDDISWESKYAHMYKLSGGKAELQDWCIEMLLRWAKEDPVSRKELDRNDAVGKAQGNRNPFIDLPGLENYVWGNLKNTAFYIANIDKPVIPDDPDDPDNPDNPDNPDKPDDPVIDPIGSEVWTAVHADSEISEEDNYCILAATADYFMSYECAGTYMSQGSYAVVGTNGEGREYVKTLGDNAAVIKFVKRGGDYAMAIYDKEGAFKGYLQCTDNKKVSLTSELNSNCDIQVSADNSGITTFDFGSGKGELQYNKQSPRFTTYTSKQDKLSLYRQPKGSTSVKDGINVPADYSVTVFNLQGVKVAEGIEALNSIPSGLYIVVDKAGRATRRAVRN